MKVLTQTLKEEQIQIEKKKDKLYPNFFKVLFLKKKFHYYDKSMN